MVRGNKMSRKLDLKSIKIAFAVFLCLLIFKGLHREFPFYACIAAVICMQGTPEDSLNIGKSRIIGTLIGGVVGYLLSLIALKSILITVLGVFIVVVICEYINKNSSTAIACVVLLAIMTNLRDTPPHIYAINRMIDTYIGIFIAVAINKSMIIEKLANIIKPI